MSKEDQHQPATVKVPMRDVGVELTLGLGPEDAVLRLEPGSQRADLQPWLLDAVAVKIACLGHHDEVPRPWDWENVLTLLEPGEELLYVLDHRAADSASRPGSFYLWLAIRFPPRLDLDGDDLGLREKRARVVISQIHRQAFPGSELIWMDPGDLLERLGTSTGPGERCVVVTGMPSPRSLDDSARDIDRDAATRNYQSLNDVVEALYELGCDYRIAFVVQRVSNEVVQEKLQQAADLYDQIHPMVQASASASATRTTSTGHSRSGSRSTGQSRSTSTAEGSNESTQKGSSTSGNVSFILIGANHARSESTTTGKSWTHTKSETTSTTTTEGSTTTMGESEGRSAGVTVELVDSQLRLADFTLHRTIDALHEAYGTGGFRWGAFAFAEGQNVNIVGRSLMGVLAGSRTKDHPLVRFEVDGERDRLLASRTPVMELVAEAAPVLSLPRVCDALLVPEAELPGLRLRRNVFLGRNVEARADDDGLIELGPDAFSAIGAESPSASIKVPGGDLFKHVLVAGTTGSGKTTRVVEILNRLESPDLSVVVFETAKRTYRSRLHRRERPAPLVYSLGSSVSYGKDSRFRPLRLNPFFFELGTPLKRHIAVLADALAELMPTEAMIGPLLRRAVETCYSERGWDIEGSLPGGSVAPTWPTVIDLVVHVRRLAEELNYGAEVNANYRGALESRAGLFLDATFQDIFGYDGNAPIDQMFPPGHDAIIEVEDLPPSDVDIRAFVMTLLLNRLRSVQGSRLIPDHGELIEKFGDGEAASVELGDALRTYFAPKVKRVSKYVKDLFRHGKVTVDGEIVRSAERVVTAASKVKAEHEHLDLQGLLAASAKAEAAQVVTRRQVDDKPRKWLVVVEEAHNVLDRQFEQRRPSDESNAGRTLLRTVVRLLQEGREMGIGLMVIDQAPTKLARDVIGNTGTKIVLRLEDADEMAEVGRAMGLEEDAWQKLGFLQVGEALVKTSYMDRPAKSAGFNKLSLPMGPRTARPAGDGWSPSFTTLAEFWRPIMRGGSSEPEAAWVNALLAASAGNVRLALFAGLRTLLMESRAGESDRDAPDLRALLASPEPTAASVLTCSRALWSGVVVAHYADEVVGVAAAICSAVEPSPAWRLTSFSGDGIAVAAHALARAGCGAEEAWLWSLGQVRRGRSTARARDTLAQLARSGKESDRTAAVRVLIAMTPEVRKWRGTDPPPSPSSLLSAVGLTLTSMLLTDDDGISDDQRNGADSFVAEIEERLARQVAARWGAVYARQVEEFLSRMSRFR
jgi:hypothetical protein